MRLGCRGEPTSGCVRGAAQRACDCAVGVRGHDRRLTDDEPVGQLQPEHDVGAAGLFAVVGEEGRRQAAPDPLAEELRLTRAAPPVGGGGSRLHAGTPPRHEGIRQAAGEAGPVGYTVSSADPRVVAPSATCARATLTAMGEGTATIRVTATDPGGLSAIQSFTVTVTTVSGCFTDDPLQSGVTPVKAVHFTELRTRIDALRSPAGLPRFSWTDPVLWAGVTWVRHVHLLEARSALAEAYAAAGRAAPRWTDASPAAESTPIRSARDGAPRGGGGAGVRRGPWNPLGARPFPPSGSDNRGLR